MHLLSLIVGLVILIFLLIGAAIVFVIGQTVWSLLCIGVVRVTRPEGKRSRWLAISIPLFAPAYLTALVLLVWWAWPDEEDAYYAAFGSSPSATTQLHHGKISGWGDSLDIELHFTATAADIQAITSNNLVLDPSYAQQNNRQHAAWLNQLSLQGKDVYTGTSPQQSFAYEDALLVYDPGTGEAWYWFQGID